MSIDLCKLLDLPTVLDARGCLTVIEGRSHIPFEIKRVYYLYKVPCGFERGAHAHKILHQLFVPIVGCFEILLDDGHDSRRVRLCRADQGLYVCPMIWRVLDNFSSDAVCMVLASESFDENDYIKNYREFADLRSRS